MWGRAGPLLLVFRRHKVTTQYCYAGAVPGAGKGEVQKRPENWVLPHESLVPELVVSTHGALNSEPAPDRPFLTARILILSAVQRGRCPAAYPWAVTLGASSLHARLTDR